MTSPLVPADVDLTDFAFMPVEFSRLLQSETWVLSNDAEKVAALTLWGRSWHEVPAGSLPDDDRMLAHLSGAGSRWKRVKPMAMRGWQLADDGRYYHPVVCEKALEAWIEKLVARVKGGKGNQSRWGAEFDADALIGAIQDCRTRLAALAPDSRTLKKQVPQRSPKDSPSDPRANPTAIAQGIPVRSQGTGTGTGTVEDQEQSPAPVGIPPGAAGAICAAVRAAGLGHANPGHPKLAEAIEAGCTTAEFVDVTHDALTHSPPKGFAWVCATTLGRRRDRATGATAHAAPRHRPSLADQVRDPSAGDQRDVIPGTATRVPNR